jgi:flagellar biosynthetic protein FlhB
MSDQLQERTEEATPRRKQEARRKGTVTKSVELVNGLVLVALLGAFPFVIARLGGAMMLGMKLGISEMPNSVEPGEITQHILTVMKPSLFAFLPLVGIALFVGVAANVAQVGFHLSWETMSPSLSKIDPIKGLKRLFSMQAGMEGLKAMAKSALFGYLALQVIQSNWSRLLTLSWLAPGSGLVTVGAILQTILTRVAVAWLILAVIDYIFQRKQIEKQLKMTKEEVKQEFKQNEQSPELRSAMAQRRRKLLKGRMAQAVKTADVVITNPTHFAIALIYDKEKMHAPQVVAKGADFLAARIRDLADDAKVPIVPNPPLARQLYKRCEVGDFVPRELFQAVAEVLAYVYGTLKKVRAAR